MMFLPDHLYKEKTIDMNMKKVMRFKTMIGYCYLYPDKIVLARNGNPEEINLKNEEQRLWKHLVFYTVIGLLLARLAYVDRDYLPMCLWLSLTSAWLLFNVLRSIILKESSTALMERDKIRSVRFKKGVRYLTRSRFIVVFEDRKGRTRYRYIFLPGSLNNGPKATEEALIAMREAGYYPFSSKNESPMGIGQYNQPEGNIGGISGL